MVISQSLAVYIVLMRERCRLHLFRFDPARRTCHPVFAHLSIDHLIRREEEQEEEEEGGTHAVAATEWNVASEVCALDPSLIAPRSAPSSDSCSTATRDT